MIGGATAFDANHHSLRSIMAEWASGRKYKARIANLRGTGGRTGASGAVRLVTTGSEATIRDDGDPDLLYGGVGQDWFFAKRKGAATDRIVDHEVDERVAGSGRKLGRGGSG